MREKQRQLAQMTLEDPAIESVTAFAGGGGPGGGSNNVGNMFVALKPLERAARRGDRRPGGDPFAPQADQRSRRYPLLQAQQDIQVGGRGSAAQYQYTLSDENLDELNTWAPQLQARMRGMKELADVSSDQQDQGLTIS